MYVTTSRKPSLSTKILAQNIASFLNSKYEPRGKKSIEDVIARADRLGYSRILVVSEQKGNPCKLAFIDIKDEWKWVFPFIIFSVRTEYVHKKIGKIDKEVEKLVKSKGKAAERISGLFEVPEPKTDDTSKLIISENSITFKYKEKRMELKIKDLLESRSEADAE